MKEIAKPFVLKKNSFFAALIIKRIKKNLHYLCYLFYLSYLLSVIDNRDHQQYKTTWYNFYQATARSWFKPQSNSRKKYSLMNWTLQHVN